MQWLQTVSLCKTHSVSLPTIAAPVWTFRLSFAFRFQNTEDEWVTSGLTTEVATEALFTQCSYSIVAQKKPLLCIVCTPLPHCPHPQVNSGTTNVSGTWGFTKIKSLAIEDYLLFVICLSCSVARCIKVLKNDIVSGPLPDINPIYFPYFLSAVICICFIAPN